MAKKKKKVLSKKQAAALEAHAFGPGNSGNPGGRPRGKTVLTRIREKLRERALKGNVGNTRLDTVADAFIRAMEAGSYHHTKEIMDREEGKVPVAQMNIQGDNIKAYMNMPTGDDPNAP